uniref:Putative secreted protein n=1 Tax=Anopheles triannulatus TaxID=58253 RepID=A0A2M4B5K5_9DIPT
MLLFLLLMLLRLRSTADLRMQRNEISSVTHGADRWWFHRSRRRRRFQRNQRGGVVGWDDLTTRQRGS